MLSRWDPFRDLYTMRRAMDRLMENAPDEDGETAEWGLPLDVIENEDSYVIRASVPGVKPDDLDITYNKGMLSIKGELKDESETTKGQYHLRERRFGTFVRTITLPSYIKPDDIHADYKDGILTLTMPKAEEVKPKRIQVKGGDGNKVIEAKQK